MTMYNYNKTKTLWHIIHMSFANVTNMINIILGDDKVMFIIKVDPLRKWVVRNFLSMIPFLSWIRVMKESHLFWVETYRDRPLAMFFYLAWSKSGIFYFRCIGEGFAYVQIKTLMSILLRNYEFSLVDGYFPEINYTTMLHTPLKPIIRYQRRHNTDWLAYSLSKYHF